MADNNAEDVGKSIIALHEFILKLAADRKIPHEDFNRAVETASGIFRKWIIHPDGRNWNLIAEIERLVNGLRA